ncbi:alpha/beta fold hydrolase [Aquirufa sp. ROCK-SH2]
MKKFFKILAWFLLGIVSLIFILFLFIGESDLSLEEMKAKYVNAESEFVPIMGMNVHFRDEGNPNDSIPILLIHGMSSSLHTFDSVAIDLKKNHRVISLDLPAFGLTGPNPENKYSLDYYAEFLDQFRQRLKIQKWSIAGNSLGGAIAWNYAVHFPNQIHRLILIDAAGYPKLNEKGSLGFLLASTPVLNKIMLFVTPKSLVRESLKSIYFDQTKVTDAQVERFHDVAIREGNRAAMLSIFDGGLKADYENIRKVKVPTLILWGDKDHLIDVGNATLFKKDIPNAKIVIFHNVGHVPMEEVPHQVSLEISRFLKP